MEPAKPYVDKVQMSFPPMDEMSWLDDERPIDVAVETPTEVVSGVAENEFLNEPVIIYSYLNYQFAMDYGSEERPIDVAVETTTVGAKGVAENESLNELVEIHSYLGNQSSVEYRADEQQIDGVVETPTDGAIRVAENEIGNESVKINSLFGKQYSVDYQAGVKCPICCLNYDNILLSKHLEQHSMKFPYVCDHCLHTFGTRILFVNHLFIHCENKCFRCLECGCKFRQVCSLRNHMTTVHGRTPPHNQNSQYDASKSHSQMKEHSKFEHNETLNNRNQYGKQENHQSVLYTSNSNIGEKTGQNTFSTPGDQGSQDNGEKDSRVLRRTVPSDSFPFNHPNNYHTAYHEHELVTFFMNNARGQNNIETGKRLAPEEAVASAPKLNKARIYCSQLDERTQMQQQLTDGPADIATDDDGGVAENGSARDCIESYFWLGNHSYSVNYGDIHKCPFCDERCNILSFKTHLQHHRFEAPYKCEFCKSSFKSLDGLENHLIMHSGNYSYKCMTCSRKFIREKAVRLHIACKHNKTENNMNQSDKEENHQNALNTSTSSSNEITNPDTCTLMNIDNQDNREDSTQLDLRNTALDGPCSSSRPSDSRTDCPEQELIWLSYEEVAL